MELRTWFCTAFVASSYRCHIKLFECNNLVQSTLDDEAPLPFLASSGKPALPWNKWCEIFKTYLTASGALVCDGTRKVAFLVTCIGVEGQRICRVLCRAASEGSMVSPNATPPGPGSARRQVAQATEGETGPYEIAVERLCRYFTPAVNKTVE